CGGWSWRFLLLLEKGAQGCRPWRHIRPADRPARPSMAGRSRERTADRAVRLRPLALPDQHALAGKIEVGHAEDGHGHRSLALRWRPLSARHRTQANVAPATNGLIGAACAAG